MAQTYYEVLGVAENATSSEIEAAFKSKAREVHPDKVPPGNSYLRKIAAEAFKDLSEAKAVLLNPSERHKYDSELAYMRGGETFSTTPKPTPSAASPPPQPSSSPAAPPSQQTKRYSFWQPRNTKFGTSCLAVLAFGGVLLLIGIAGSEQAASLGLACIAMAFGLLCWRHGSRPMTDSAYLGGSIFLFIFALVFFYVGLQSTASVANPPASPPLASTRAMTPTHPISPCSTSDGSPCIDGGQTSSRANTPSKPLQRASTSPRSKTDPILEAIRGTSERASNSSSAEDTKAELKPQTAANYVTKTWKNLKDGQLYRTHSKGETLYVETADNYQNRTGDLISCEFQRAVSPGVSWTGSCWVRNPKDQSAYRSPATLSTFSYNRIEGSTTYIPNFAMVPAESIAGVAPHQPIVDEEPTRSTSAARSEALPSRTRALADLTGPERQSIEAACSIDKYNNGPAAYNRCLQNHLNLLSAAPRRPDLSGLSGPEQQSIEAACSVDKYNNGPAAYNRCLQGQLSLLRAAPQRPDLASLSGPERQSIEAACSIEKYNNGPAAYNRCLVRQLELLRGNP